MWKRIMLIVFLIFAALVIAGFSAIYIQNSRVPDLGVTNGQFMPLKPTPNNVSTQTDVAEKKVAPWPFKGTEQATMAAIKQAVESYGGAQIKKETDDYLYVVFTTSVMHFHDDAEFWLDTKDRLVQFQSSSRAGKSDLGLNRQRYDALTELYNQAP